MSNADDRYADIKEKLRGYAESDGDIRAVVLFGSSVRKQPPADEHSDIDLFIVTEAPELWYSGEYPSKLGDISISFIEPTLGGGKERRSVYSGYRDADMLIFTPEQYRKALEDGEAGCVLERGFTLLYDSGGYAELTARYVSPSVRHTEMTEEEFVNLVNDFFFHNIWACKKLLRGELWSAKMCIDSYLKERLLRVTEELRLCEGAEVWHCGRFFDSWAGSGVLGSLSGCFSLYDRDGCMKALEATHELFARIAAETAVKRGWEYPAQAEKCAKEFLEENIK